MINKVTLNVNYITLMSMYLALIYKYYMKAFYINRVCNTPAANKQQLLIVSFYKTIFSDPITIISLPPEAI